MGGGASKRRKAEAEAAKNAKQEKDEDVQAQLSALAERLDKVQTLERELAARKDELDRREEDLFMNSAMPSNLTGMPPSISGLPSTTEDTGAGEGSQDAQAEERSKDKKTRGRRKSLFFEPEADSEPPRAEEAPPAPPRPAAPPRDAMAPTERREATAPRPVLAVEQRAVSVFVLSSLAGGEHSVLRADVYPRVVSDAARRGVAMRVVDLRDERLRGHEEEAGGDEEGAALLLDQMLFEAMRCAPVCVGLLGRQYQDGIGSAVLEVLEKLGHIWVNDEDAAGDKGPLRDACATDVLLRFWAPTQEVMPTVMI